MSVNIPLAKSTVNGVEKYILPLVGEEGHGQFLNKNPTS